MQSIDTDAQFVYNENGLRVKKTVNGVVTDYTLHGKNIVHMKRGDDELHFFYDAQNRPAVVVYNGTAYAYVKSLQGDIVAILDENGNTVVSYGYDAWGAPIGKSGTFAETLGKVQPFRYRGYVFDEETGLYYLRSRYYNAERCRFVNADALVSTLQQSNKHNLFSYCGNSVISYIDPDGLFAIQGLLLAGMLAACTLLLSGCAAKTDYGAASPYKPTTSREYNCYAYALGETEWKFVGGREGAVQDFSVENVAQMVLDDAKADGRAMRIIDSYDSPINANEYRIALRTALRPGSEDYHFMLQHSDGSWSHKPGTLSSRLIDGDNPSEITWDAPSMIEGLTFVNYYKAKLCILLLLSERGVIELKKNHVVYYIIATALFCGIVCLIVASYNKTNGDENMKQCFTTEDLATIQIGVSTLDDVCAIVPIDNVIATSYGGLGELPATNGGKIQIRFVGPQLIVEDIRYIPAG